MQKVITLVLYNRPAYTKVIFDALRRCEDIDEYLILPHVETGNEEVLELAKAIDFAEVQITVNSERFGIGRNTFLAWEHGFKESDFIIHIEDDTVPSRDCLRYMEHCREAYRNDENVFSVATHNREPCPPESHYEISRRRAYNCWLVGLWRDRWEWCKGKWSPDPERYANHLHEQLNRHALKEIYPKLSRSQNIGAEGGVHVPSAEWHREHHHTEHWAGNFDLPPGNYFEKRPLVTAVMVTGLHKARYPLARLAIECFQKQIYPNKELLIINHGEESLACEDSRIREIRVTKTADQTVGDLRNLGIENAQGDYLISWDDDDWHHPMRISTQMDAQTDGAAVFLKNRVHCSLENGCADHHQAPGGAVATILHPRAVPFRYPSLVRGSDKEFAWKFKNRVAIDNDPMLYVRFCHGLNLWSAQHIMGRLSHPTMKDELQVDVQHKKPVAELLSLYRQRMPVSQKAHARLLEGKKSETVKIPCLLQE